jgi:hypothetical protein
MINESAVNKHFKKVWRDGQILVENSSPGYLISDINIILRVSKDLKLFNDRALFPELPPENKCYIYGKLRGFQKDGPKIEELIKRFLKEDLTEIQATPWRYENAVLMYNDEKHLFVDQRFLNMLNLVTNHIGYNDTKRTDSPVIYGNSKDVKKVFAVIMPMRIYFTSEDSNRFPNIPELIDVTM